MTTKNLYLDIHVLQTVPSSNLNRDDAGAPKTALYGGVTRSRVSSQSWKHAMREQFNEDANQPKGLRTKDAPIQLKLAMQGLNPDLSDEDAEAKAGDVFAAAGMKLKDFKTTALLLISQGQIDALAKYALSHNELDKKELKAVLKGEQSLDLALFGRMVADNPELNVDASAQVAHAVSTHEVVPEYDYYTALDDLQPKDNAGAAMLGAIQYNSSTLYRYANLNLNELVKNLGGDAAEEGSLEFIKSFLLSMPSGKQNSFANKTLPSYVMINFRTDTPVNLVSAFEDPVTAKDEGYVKPSITRLENEFKRTEQFVDKPELTLVLGDADSSIGQAVPDIKALLDQVGDYLKKAVPDENADA